MGHVGPLPFAHLQVAEGVPVDVRRRHHEGTRGERVEDGSPVLVHKASDVAAVVAPVVGGWVGVGCGGGRSKVSIITHTVSILQHSGAGGNDRQTSIIPASYLVIVELTCWGTRR